MSSRNRPAYIERKIALERAKREALRTHVKPCDCPFCLTPTRTRELVDAALARNPGRNEEVPF